MFIKTWEFRFRIKIFGVLELYWILEVQRKLVFSNQILAHNITFTLPTWASCHHINVDIPIYTSKHSPM